MCAVDQPLHACERRLFGYRVFVSLSTLQISDQDSLLELNVPKVPGSLGVHECCSTELAG